MQKLNKNFFSSEIGKLAEQFGASKFSRRKTDLIYQAVQYLTPRELTYVVDDIIGNARFAPNLDDFRARARQFKKEINTLSDCVKCGGDGLLVRYEIETGRCFSFSCYCEAGFRYPKIPKIGTVQENKFTKFAPITLKPNKRPYGEFRERWLSYLSKTNKTAENRNLPPNTTHEQLTSLGFQLSDFSAKRK